MNDPFAFVLYIDRGRKEHLVSLHKSLDEAEDALRAYSRTIVVGANDNEIIEVLAEDGIHARIYACVQQRRGQNSIELVPFGEAAAA